jgi:hypothetical protein
MADKCCYHDPTVVSYCTLKKTEPNPNCKGDISNCPYTSEPAVLALATAKKGQLEKTLAESQDMLDRLNASFPDLQ